MNEHDLTPPSAMSESTVYTCSMHREIRQDGPGDCPKCGMHLVPEGEVESQGKHDHHGPNHHGHDHSATAKGGEFDRVPAGFVGAVYTCPMHQQVRQTHPGACPICGMGLELESATMVDE